MPCPRTHSTRCSQTPNRQNAKCGASAGSWSRSRASRPVDTTPPLRLSPGGAAPRRSARSSSARTSFRGSRTTSGSDSPQQVARIAASGSSRVPQDGDPCLYCMQPLSPTAIGLLTRYRTFLDETLRPAAHDSADRSRRGTPGAERVRVESSDGVRHRPRSKTRLPTGRPGGEGLGRRDHRDHGEGEGPSVLGNQRGDGSRQRRREGTRRPTTHPCPGTGWPSGPSSPTTW